MERRGEERTPGELLENYFRLVDQNTIQFYHMHNAHQSGLRHFTHTFTLITK